MGSCQAADRSPGTGCPVWWPVGSGPAGWLPLSLLLSSFFALSLPCTMPLMQPFINLGTQFIGYRNTVNGLKEALLTADKRADDLAIKLKKSEEAREKAEKDASSIEDLRKRLHEAETALSDKITQQIAREENITSRLESLNRRFVMDYRYGEDTTGKSRPTQKGRKEKEEDAEAWLWPALPATLGRHCRASNELWRIIEEGFKPYNPNKLTRREAVDSQLNVTALHMIQTSVGTKDLSRIRNFTTAKEAWDGLAASCIGSESTRRNKYNSLKNKAEGFMRLPDEDHEDMYARLITVADAFRIVGATHINDSWIKDKYIDCMMPFEPIDVKTLVGRECYSSLTSQQAVHEMQALKVLEQNSHDTLAIVPLVWQKGTILP
ncbi:hypothetical protein QYE76_017290 [Lolium multiflorum]|uniref:Uncharacterized protein n=1 Tax=Lolium multiflorum TaxID=4521 RepID=A0AAD8PH20_LOLMU|nr:hypothetical protein QYE76_017290 [Lolium multiflorum]